jgi:hypothetical protein
MADLKFSKPLTKAQRDYAEMIINEANKQGVPYQLALGIAFNESGINPNAPDGSAGEIGIMQVKPGTGVEVGFTAQDLRDPAKNIQAGIAYLKKSYDLSDKDPELAAAGYNAGINHAFFTEKGKGLPSGTKEYLRKLRDSGVFEAIGQQPPPEAPAEAPPAAEAAAEAPAEAQAAPAVAAPPDDTDARMAAAQAEQEERMGQIAGGTAGVLLAGTRGLAKGASSGITSAANILGEGFAQGLTRNAPPAVLPGAPPSAPPGAPIAPANVRPGGLPINQAGGSATFNYGKAFGLPDIEAGRALDMSKQTGGASDLINKRREALLRVQQMFPGEFVENPRFGGIMTPDPSVGAGPRAPYAANVLAGEQRPPNVIGRAKPPPIPMTSKPGLDGVVDDFKRMVGPGSPVGKIVGGVMKYVAPPLALAQAGGEFANLYGEFQKPKPDVGVMARRGIGGVGSVLSAFPGTAPIGIPMAVAPGAYEAYLRNRKSMPGVEALEVPIL